MHLSISQKLALIKNESSQIENALAQKHLLLIGAGGIGCELLKCLVTCGIKKITIVDLDKVEKSNLNRQFLFDAESIGKFKAEMAKDSILKMTGKHRDLAISSIVGDIKDIEKFSFEFFEKFDLVLNALDNIEARSYINRICLRKEIPLINSGTEGFLGSVFCFYGKQTACYDCSVKIKQKTIPVCSIRSKPEKPEHCVAWAKALLELFMQQKEREVQESITNPLDDFLKFLAEDEDKENGKRRENKSDETNKSISNENCCYDNAFKGIDCFLMLFKNVFSDGIFTDAYEQEEIQSIIFIF